MSSDFTRPQSLVLTLISSEISMWILIMFLQLWPYGTIGIRLLLLLIVNATLWADYFWMQEVLTSSSFVYWKRPPGRPRMTWMKMVQNDLDSHGLSWTDAVDLAQNRPLWNQWRYALVVVQAGEEKVLMYQRSAPKIKVTISLSVQLFKHYLFSVSISASCLL